MSDRVSASSCTTEGVTKTKAGGHMSGETETRWTQQLPTPTSRSHASLDVIWCVTRRTLRQEFRSWYWWKILQLQQQQPKSQTSVESAPKTLTGIHGAQFLGKPPPHQAKQSGTNQAVLANRYTTHTGTRRRTDAQRKGATHGKHAAMQGRQPRTPLQRATRRPLVSQAPPHPSVKVTVGGATSQTESSSYPWTLGDLAGLLYGSLTTPC
ncbi:hypothetical protein BaRGS_00013408 [Batillaria attramentaria]|uniref:Uncharacterized protein n=1 Tax=Batillaria attramentaria TaxID=370345 RepID=A0ABD0L7H4_9CAEN